MTERVYVVVEFRGDDLPSVVRRAGNFRKMMHGFREAGDADVILRPDQAHYTISPTGWKDVDVVMTVTRQRAAEWRERESYG